MIVDKLKKYFWNKKGIGLVQVLALTGLVAGVGVGVMQVMQSTSRLAKTAAFKFQEDEILFNLESVLKDNGACEKSLGLTSLGGPKDPNGNGVTFEEIRDANDSLVFKAGCGPANLKECIYGQATKGRIFLKSFTIKQYNNGASPWDNSGGRSTLEIEMVKGAAIEKFDTLSPAEKSKFAQQAFGAIMVVKRLRLKTGLDASGDIQYCVADERDILKESCEYFQGTQDVADLKCKNVTVETADTTPAVINDGNLLVEKNSNTLDSVNVGLTPPGTLTDGMLNVAGDSTIGKNIVTQGDFLFLNRATISRDGVNDSMVLAGATNLDRVTLFLGNSGASINGRANKMGINLSANTTPASALEVNGDLTTQISLNVNKNILIARSGAIGGTVDFSGDVTIKRNAVTSIEIDGGAISITPPYNDKSTSNNNYIATQDWIENQFLVRLGDQAVQQILNQILNNAAGDSRVKTLKQNICNSIKNATWNGSDCVSSGNQICSSTQAMQGLTNGIKNCVNKYKNTQNCSNSNPPTSIMTGVNSNGSLICRNLTTMFNNIVNQVLGAVNVCYSKYPTSSGYYSHSYDPGTNRCTAYKNNSQTSNKDGCGAWWGKDSAADCGCWSGWSWAGSNGCSYNWVVTGGQCTCRRYYVSAYSCAVSGSWCY